MPSNVTQLFQDKHESITRLFYESSFAGMTYCLYLHFRIHNLSFPRTRESSHISEPNISLEMAPNMTS
jgi:hypothetical protein